jgi:hypothetical protein
MITPWRELQVEEEVDEVEVFLTQLKDLLGVEEARAEILVDGYEVFDEAVPTPSLSMRPWQRRDFKRALAPAFEDVFSTKPIMTKI